MTNKSLWIAVTVLFAVGTSIAGATTDWSTQDYDLYTGDFDGDAKTDVLYIAKDASRASGIARSDGSGPNIPFQSWPANYLGIPWSGNAYLPIVADFNGDGKADIFLQRATPGDNYLLLADSQGKIIGINQTVSNSALGIAWSADQHKLAAGDFNNDGKADLFFQATSSSGLNAVVLADSNGQFTAGPLQSWNDGQFGFKWSTRNSNIYVGDLNGDGKKDLLVQAKPNIVMVDYDIPIPVPVYPANSNGVVLSQGGATPFQLVGVQQWSRNANGVDWSPNASTVVVGDFNGDGRADVLLQARRSGLTSYLLTGNASGAALSSGTAVSANVTISADSARLVAGNFDGSGGVGIYIQATTPAGVNYLANTVGASTSATAHDPSLSMGTVPSSVVGHTVGSFSVSNTGAATYSVPIVVPPGVAGVQPQLSINYDSHGGNGLLGVGASLGGFSEIERCNKTLAQDNSSDAVSLTTADRFCLDGNKLRLTSGTYGASGSTYQTELETFSRVTAFGTAGNGPAYFVVETKQGLRMEYGNSVDSSIEAINGGAGYATTVHTWALNKVSDSYGNTMSLSYQKDGAPNGSFRPIEISYTSNSAASLAAAYRVRFEWDTRPSNDVLFTYSAGTSTKETKRLNRVETQYNDPVGGWRLVRKYQLSYNTAGASPRSRLSSIQECDGSNACLAPTIFSWYDGLTGWEDTSIVSPASSTAVMDAAYAIDMDADGRSDLVYPQASGATTYWYSMKATTSGQYGAPAATTFATSNYVALPIDYSATGRRGLLTSITGSANLQIVEWNPATSALIKTATNITGTLQGSEWVGDFNGDGREDYMYATSSGGTATYFLRANTGMSSGVAQFATAVAYYSTTTMGTPTAPTTEWSRTADFNGDGRTDLLARTHFLDCEGGSGCVPNAVWLALMSTGTSFVQAGEWDCEGDPCLSMPPAVADFNGDGFSDAIVLQGNQATKSFAIRYGHSRGMTSAGTIATFTSGTASLPADYDGDGRTDWLFVSGTTWYLKRATESGFEAQVATNIPAVTTNTTHRVLDLDGDGQVDIGFKDSTWQVRRHRGGVPDLIKSVTDGFGNSINLTYAPLTDSSVYTPGAGATFPKAEVTTPLYVVKQYSAADGLGGSYAVTRKYAGLRVHVQGRGMLGFASVETTDGRTGIRSSSSFLQDYPFIGFVSDASTFQPGSSVLISKVTNTAAELTPQGGLYNDRHFPYLQQSTQDNYEVGGTANSQQVTKTTATTVLDSYGNPTSVVTGTADATTPAQIFSTSSANTYAPADTTNWCLGSLTQQQVTNVTPTASSQTRTVQYVKDVANPAACRVSSQIVEPNDNALKVTTAFTYDAFGHPNSQTVNALNVTTRTSSTDYGTQGVFPLSATNALGNIAYKTYDFALGVPLTATDPNTLEISWIYDGFGRLLQENRPDSTKTSWTYSACNVGNGYCGDSRLRYQVEKKELDSNNGVIRSSIQMFDALGRSLYDQSQTLSGAFSVVATNYDSQGRAYQRSQPYFAGSAAYFTTLTYDLVGRPKTESRRISETDSGTQTATYDYVRFAHSQTDPNGKTTEKKFDPVGQVVQMTDAGAGVTKYEYDSFGDLTKTIDPLNNEIRNTFNVRGFKLNTRDPDMGTWGYTYYPTGELFTQTDQKSQVVTFTYDKLSRPLTRVEPEGTTNFNYGTSSTARNIGKLESVTSPGAYSENYAYDSLGRPQDITTNADSGSFVVSSSYNSTTGFLDSVTYPTSTSAVTGSRFKVQYEYANGLLKRTKDFYSPATVYWEQVATNAAGRTIDEQSGNGLHTYSTFDAISGFLGARTTGATSQVQNLSYQWDKTGNLTQRKDSTLSITEDFYYDNLYRLDYSKLNGVTNLDVGYDALGNITTKSDVGTYTYAASGTNSARPHAVTAAGSAAYGYDANGNMNARNGSTITWYSYNLPNRIDKGSNYSQFFYGAGRSRYKQVAVTAAGGPLPAGTESTVYIGGLFEKVTKPSGVIEYKHYIMAGTEAVAIRTLRSNSANDTRYLHKDHLGSVDAITNEAGAVVLRLSYDAFGKRRSATAWSGSPTAGDWTSIASITHRAFTFHEDLDNLDLIHMNGRVYDPNIGRFISADPFIQAPLMSQSLNRYSYVMNNPLSLVDPSGYSWLSKAFRSIGKFVSRYWREIVAVVAAYFTGGLAYGAYGGALGGTTAAIAGGVVAGAVYSATVTALYGGSMGDVFRNALIGGALGGVAGWSNFMSAPVTAGVLGGAASTGTPGGSPPMTAPAGAISFGAGGVSDAFNATKSWFLGLWGGGGLHYRGRTTTETIENAEASRMIGVDAAAKWLRSRGLISYSPAYRDYWEYQVKKGLFAGCTGDDYTCGGQSILVAGLTNDLSREVTIYRGAITRFRPTFGYRAGHHGDPDPFTVYEGSFHSSFEKSIFALRHEEYHHVNGGEPKDLDFEAFANAAAWDAVLSYRRSRGE